MNQNEFRKYAIKHHGISSLTVDSYTSSLRVPVGLTPYIIEERPMNVASMDVFSRLMMDRIIFLGEGINDYSPVREAKSEEYFVIVVRFIDKII